MSEISTNNFYQTEEDFFNAINSTYAILQPVYGQHMYQLAELRSDNTFLDGDPGGNRQSLADIDFFQVQTTNATVLDFWDDSYKGIANANTVLDRIEGVTFANEDLKNQITGEAYFLRALYYFNLVRVFGAVPLVVNEVRDPAESRNHTRKPLAEVYSRIESDLGEAIRLLPVAYEGNPGRATQWAAKVLLGKVQLTQKKYAEATTSLGDVVNNGPYALEASYRDIFDPANKNGQESIFEVQYDGNVVNEGSPFVNLFAPRFSTTVAPSGQGLGNNQPTDDMINAYAPGEIRFDASLDTTYANVRGEAVSAPYITKFLNGTSMPNQGLDNFPVLRYADVLLMLAEAQFFQDGGGIEYVNEVRTRAGLDALMSLSLEAILQERRVELAYENHRWFDLLRTDQAISIMSEHLATRNIGATSIAPYQLLYPIPQAQIDANPDALDQNPGYE